MVWSNEHMYLWWYLYLEYRWNEASFFVHTRNIWQTLAPYFRVEFVLHTTGVVYTYVQIGLIRWVFFQPKSLVPRSRHLLIIHPFNRKIRLWINVANSLVKHAIPSSTILSSSVIMYIGVSHWSETPYKHFLAVWSWPPSGEWRYSGSRGDHLFTSSSLLVDHW